MYHSVLVASSNKLAEPVVDRYGEVIGHIGWFSGDHIHLPKGFAKYHKVTEPDLQALNNGIQAGEYVLASSEPSVNELADLIEISVGDVTGRRPDPQPVFQQYDPNSYGLPSYESFQLLTDVQGRVVTAFGGHTIHEGVTSYTPLETALIVVQAYDLTILARGAFELGVLASRGIIKTIEVEGLGEATSEGIAAFGREAAAAVGTEAKDGMALVNAIRAEGRPVIVNIGGAGEEVGAINLNPNTVAPRKGIPNLIPRPGEEIDQIFSPGSLDGMVSNRLPPNTLDWSKIIPGLKKVLRPGATIAIRFQGVGEDAKIIVNLLNDLGFKNIKNHFGAAIEAIR